MARRQHRKSVYGFWFVSEHRKIAKRIPRVCKLDTHFDLLLRFVLRILVMNWITATWVQNVVTLMTQSVSGPDFLLFDSSPTVSRFFGGLRKEIKTTTKQIIGSGCPVKPSSCENQLEAKLIRRRQFIVVNTFIISSRAALLWIRPKKKRRFVRLETKEEVVDYLKR